MTAVERVRFGGHREPGGWVFELSGGHPALDLANTRDQRPTPQPRELLPDYETLVRWAEQSGVASPAEARALRREASAQPRAAQAALRAAREVREAIFRTFTEVASGGEPAPGDLDVLNRHVAAALAVRRLEPAPGGARWAEPGAAGRLERAFWPAVRAAADLLVSPEVRRVRVCAAPDCAWLFLDTSRGGRRRWCDMTVCGNREKARRFSRRSRA